MPALAHTPNQTFARISLSYQIRHTRLFYNMWRHTVTRFIFYATIVIHLALPFGLWPEPDQHPSSFSSSSSPIASLWILSTGPALVETLIMFVYLFVITLEGLSFGFSAFYKERHRTVQVSWLLPVSLLAPNV